MTAIVRHKQKPAILILYAILAVIAAFGLALGIYRLINGLGAATNLNNGYPWGLWIAFDFFAVPFSAGAFTLAFVSIIYNRRDYHGVAHLALLAGFLGYLMVVLVLILDISRWDQFWSVLVPSRWNLHSFMFEVAMSITLYFGVMILELIPVVFPDRGRQPVLIISQLIALIAAVGILLSTVHQGSIGGIFVILEHRLHELWWSPILSLLFLNSALFSGLSVAIFLAIHTWRALKRPVPMRLLSGLARAAAILMVIYLVLKVGDLLLAGELDLLFNSGRFSVIWWAEVIIGVVAPMIIFFSSARNTERGLLAGAFCVFVGLLVNRATQAWFALQPPEGATYSPYWMEWGIVAAAFAGGILFFMLGTRYLQGLREPVEEGH